MDYVAQLNSFWQWRKQYELSCRASLMYLALLHLAEQSQSNEVLAKRNEIMQITGIGKNNVYCCRKELEEAGLITFSEGNGGKTPVYCIKELIVPSPCLGTRSDQPSPTLGTRSDVPSPDLGTSSDAPSPCSGTSSPTSSPCLGTRSQLPSNMYINNINNNNNNTITNNNKLVQVYTEQTETEEQVNQRNCLGFFENNIRPIGNRFEGENLVTLISEYGVEAFKGAVLLAKKNSVNNGGTWRWMQTVLTNGDWKYGYEDRPKKKKRVARIPAFDVVDLIGE